ncbi:MAG: SPW repeat domain-containing protein [Sciscionella sp.]
MTHTSPRAWSRWQDYVEVVLGVVAALSSLWVNTSTAATWAMVVLGVLIALDGLWSLAQPGAIASESIEIVFGVLLFISPWVLAYTSLGAAAWTSWIIGALTVLTGVVALPAANTAHRGMAGAH